MPVAFLYNRKLLEGEEDDDIAVALSEVPFETADEVRKQFYIPLKNVDLSTETERHQDKFVGVLAANVQATTELSAGDVHEKPKRIADLNAHVWLW